MKIPILYYIYYELLTTRRYSEDLVLKAIALYLFENKYFNTSNTKLVDDVIDNYETSLFFTYTEDEFFNLNEDRCDESINDLNLNNPLNTIEGFPVSFKILNEIYRFYITTEKL